MLSVRTSTVVCICTNKRNNILFVCLLPEMSMIRWMRGVKLNERKKSEELKENF